MADAQDALLPALPAKELKRQIIGERYWTRKVKRLDELRGDRESAPTPAYLKSQCERDRTCATTRTTTGRR